MMKTLHTAWRVFGQLRHDPRTVVMILLVPPLLMGLLAWLFQDQDQVFQQVGPALLSFFPLVLMFLITSVATLRERQSGTLERLLTMPVSKVSFILGYALAFGLMAALQAMITTAVSVGWLGLEIEGPLGLLMLVAVVNGLVGTCLGLLCSGFAASEFQAVQFMPIVLIPQLLLCGLLMPAEDMPDVLQAVSRVLPLRYAVDAMQEIAASADPAVAGDLWFLLGCAVVFVVCAAATLRRRTP